MTCFHAQTIQAECESVQRPSQHQVYGGSMGDGGEIDARKVVAMRAEGDIVSDLHCIILLWRRRWYRQESNDDDDEGDADGDGDGVEMKMEMKMRTND